MSAKSFSSSRSLVPLSELMCQWTDEWMTFASDETPWINFVVERALDYGLSKGAEQEFQRCFDWVESRVAKRIAHRMRESLYK